MHRLILTCITEKLKYHTYLLLHTFTLNYTGWGKITSVNFKVNNKITIRDTNILFLDSETTTWEGLNHIVLKRISCKWWPLFAWCLHAERLGDCKTDRLTASMFSGVREVRGRPHLFTDTLPVSLKFSTHNRMDFQSRYSVPRGDFGNEYGTHTAPLR